MKKNISINISGIIFHIEEDGYNDLKNYLESINKYFSTFDDNSEIIADIESRIAEIFLTKLDDSKQIIIMEDVTSLIDTMGTIADFEAVEEDIPQQEEQHEPKNETTEEQSSNKTDPGESKSEYDNPGKHRLLRDEKRRVLGGVASGIGYYLSIDPIWIRLIMVVLFLNLFFGPLSGAVFMAYIVLWIVIPGSTMLGEDEHVKKMFRDSESRVLGGVASGIGAYFGIDVTIVRLIFVLSVFLGGSGFIIYVIFWLITPEAKSITEKMQMQGEPVTLSNIQQSVKKSLHNDQGEESALAKILLFPFRVIAKVFEAIGKLLGPFSKVLVDVIRVFAGILLMLIGLSVMVALLVSVGALFGVFTGMSEYMMIHDFPLSFFADSFSPLLYFATFFAAFLPFFIISILGLSIIAKRMVMKATLGWTVFGLWVVSLVIAGILIPSTVSSFSRYGDYKETKILDVKNEPVVLRVNYLKGQRNERKMLRLRGHQDSTFRYIMNFSSKGKTRHEAIENAKMITYGAKVTNGEIYFDSNFEYKEGAVFRAQDLESTLYIPYGYNFKMEDDLLNILSNTISRSDFSNWQVVEENTWVITEDGLSCVTCPKPSRDIYEKDAEGMEYYPSESNVSKSNDKSSRKSMSFELEDFEVIDLRGIFNVTITQSNEYDVRIQGDSRYRDDVIVKKIDDVLEIGFNKKKWDLLRSLSDDDDRIDLFISLPQLVEIKSTGFCEIDVNDFETRDLKIDLTGGSSVDLDVESNELIINMNGGSRMDLEGKSKYVSVDMSGASSFNSVDMNVYKMDLKASGVSNARVKVKDKFKVEVYGLSNVRYSGDPKVEILGQGGMSVVQPAQ
ncbi:MAG: PspC domain-containing protein [Reichenbachiella sp.]